MDFKDYINGLSDLDNQEVRAELETFYALNATTFKFFKVVDETLQDLFKQSNVSAKAKAQLEDILPILIKLRSEILSLEQYTFAIGYKEKVDVAIQYIKDKMVLNEVEDVAHKFYKLLEDNESALIAEKKIRDEIKIKEREEIEAEKKLTPIQKAEKLFLENGLSKCDAPTLWMLADKSKNKQILESIARQNPSFTHVDNLLEKYDADNILQVIADNPNTPPGVLQFLAFECNTGDKDDDEALRSIVASNPNITEKIAIRLANDKSSVVRKCIINNPRTPERTRQTLKNSEGCFIATACYGDYDAPEVIILRRYRDEYLLTNWLGNLFVRFYYAVSPSIARCLEKSDMVKSFIRNYFLRPIVRRIQCKYSNKN